MVKFWEETVVKSCNQFIFLLFPFKFLTFSIQTESSDFLCRHFLSYSPREMLGQKWADFESDGPGFEALLPQSHGTLGNLLNIFPP